ncbi:MAG: hypothetical protein JW807_13935 [Spirochaetes bacterium]|nr:hypothetical protein [Spirochaetota bacterium]
MKRSIFGITIFLAILSLSMPAVSQKKGANPKADEETMRADNAGKKDEKGIDPSKLYVDLTGVMYLEWAYNTGFSYDGTTEWGGMWGKVPRWGVDTTYFPQLTAAEPSNISYNKTNTFRMQRAYLTLRKRIGELFSVKVTADIDPNGQDFIYLKYGFIQLFKEFGSSLGPVSIKVQLGKIGTPVIGITNKLNDLRWIGKNYLTNSKIVLNGKSFDDSADLGGLFSLSFLNLATIEYSITNGEGLKSDNNETYGGKAHTLLVSVNPVDYVKELYVNFYGRWEDTDRNILDTGPVSAGGYPVKYQGVDKRSYMGFGVAWYSDLIKLGLNFFMPVKEYSKTFFSYLTTFNVSPFEGYRPRHKDKFYLIDSWLNFNLGAITPLGFLVVGRCAYGQEMKGLLANNRVMRETLVLGGGAGYQFNKHLRLVLYYENIRYHSRSKWHSIADKDPSLNNNVYIKAEAKY